MTVSNEMLRDAAKCQEIQQGLKIPPPPPRLGLNNEVRRSVFFLIVFAYITGMKIK